MQKLLFLIAPIILALLTFSVFVFFLSQGSSGKGALQVTAIPQSAVYLNGKFLGNTPLCKCDGNDKLVANDYTLKLVPLAGDNLVAFEQKVTISKSILTVVDRTFGEGAESSGFVINLTPLTDKNATELFVSSFPSGASLAIDKNDSGVSPQLIKNITASDHDLVLSKSGYASKTVHIQTHAGYQLNAVISLGLLPPDASEAADFNNSLSLTPIQPEKVVILQTPTGYLRVRTDPTLVGSESAEVKPGEVYNLTAEQDGWYQIKLKDGTLGWISTTYAQKE